MILVKISNPKKIKSKQNNRKQIRQVQNNKLKIRFKKKPINPHQNQLILQSLNKKL